MPGEQFDIGILGGGSAGLTVAAAAAQLGAKTLLVDKSALGGDCLYCGCVPSKTLIRSAKVYHDAKRMAGYGLPPADVPPVYFPALVERIRSVIRAIERRDSPERFCSLGARVEIGNPVFSDEHSIRMNGKTFSSRTWVISTGSSAAIPSIPGLDRAHYLTNRDIFSLERLPASLIVIGGGPIGIEMGQAFSRLGTSVEIIQHSGQILDREDPDMAGRLQEVLAAEGIRIHLAAAVESVRDIGHAREATVRIGGETREIRAEALLVAAGRTANLEGLGLERLGIRFDRRGLALDERLRTDLKHIYGAGDVTGNFLFTHSAGYEGGIVISNAVFRLPRKLDYTFMPWCTYTDPELASIGMNEKRAAAAGVKYSVWTEEFADNDRALAEGEAAGRIKMILNEREKPIGVQILGSRAGELLGAWVAALNGKVRLSTMASAVQPYPTLAEISRKVTGDVLARKLFSDTVRKGLKFFFSLRGRACP